MLIIGLPDSGKTTLMNKFNGFVKIDGTEMRRFTADWDFSINGRKRQAKRIASILRVANRSVVASYICPTSECMDILLMNCPELYVIWMDTVKECKYKDTNEIWQEPKNYDLRITDFDYDAEEILEKSVRG